MSTIITRHSELEYSRQVGTLKSDPKTKIIADDFSWSHGGQKYIVYHDNQWGVHYDDQIEFDSEYKNYTTAESRKAAVESQFWGWTWHW